ncbi:hypothetical protein PI124_g6091 [Phytophthora idaei]|nr:hypothetical protein PI125_g5160 [Phytophthora idaei]KAG3249251.1 hypothetical protein PI124_g6091 [Phytophthora idaei]
MARVVTISNERVEDVIELAKHAGELTRTVRAHMYHNNFILAFRAFEQLPHLEAMHLWYIEEIIRSFFLGLIDMQTLLNFFGILPISLWALEGVEKLHSSIEMCVEVGHFQTGLAPQRICPVVPVVRFLGEFKNSLTGAARLRAERCWDQLASPTVRAIIAGGEFVVESVARKCTHQLMVTPIAVTRAQCLPGYRGHIGMTATARRDGALSKSTTQKTAS